jgi:hypothetical protein
LLHQHLQLKLHQHQLLLLLHQLLLLTLLQLLLPLRRLLRRLPTLQWLLRLPLRLLLRPLLRSNQLSLEEKPAFGPVFFRLRFCFGQTSDLPFSNARKKTGREGRFAFCSEALT